jgi:hypothetical protein
MAKMHQRIDDLIDALVWIRGQESSPFGVAAKTKTQVDNPIIRHLGTDEEFQLFAGVGHLDLPV